MREFQLGIQKHPLRFLGEFSQPQDRLLIVWKSKWQVGLLEVTGDIAKPDSKDQPQILETASSPDQLAILDVQLKQGDTYRKSHVAQVLVVYEAPGL